MQILIVYADFECLIEKIDGSENNLENSSTTKIGKNIPSGFSIHTMSSFKSKENKHDICRGKYCRKMFCEYLRQHPMKIIKFEKSKMKLLINKPKKSNENAKLFYICNQKSGDKYAQN